MAEYNIYNTPEWGGNPVNLCRPRRKEVKTFHEFEIDREGFGYLIKVIKDAYESEHKVLCQERLGYIIKYINEHNNDFNPNLVSHYGRVNQRIRFRLSNASSKYDFIRGIE